ncbi:hypothetical protein PG984_008519 [Apiospora sp. TS-2023a]
MAMRTAMALLYWEASEDAWLNEAIFCLGRGWGAWGVPPGCLAETVMAGKWEEDVVFGECEASEEHWIL